MRTRSITSSLVLAGALGSVIAACGGTEQQVALGEPIVVVQGSFKHGELPSDPAEADAGTDGGTALVVSSILGANVLRPGARGLVVSGGVSESSYSVGVRLAEQGHGYWVQPVGAPDPLIPDQLTFSVSFDANTSIEPGLNTLVVVAFDKDARPGPKVELPVCVASELPDNLNVCNPKASPPLAIASLRWDADSDLDLTVVAPDGTTYGRNKRTLLSGSTVVANLDNDGTIGCLVDGRRMENFSWSAGTPGGTWKIYANLYDSCAVPAVSFELTIYQRQSNPDGTFGLSKVQNLHGSFVRQQANGGAGAPLFLTDLQFQ